MSPTDDAIKVLRFWHAVELFSPQEVPETGRTDVVDVRPGEPMPWEPGSRLSTEAIRPDQVWRHDIYGGVYERRKVRDVLVERFTPDLPEGDQQASDRGQSALFACTVDAEGVLVEGSAVLSTCSWAVGRLLDRGRSPKTWLEGFDRDALRYGNELGVLAGSRWNIAVRLLAASMRSAVPAAVGAGLQTAAASALAPVAGPLAPVGGAIVGSIAGSLATAAVGNPSPSGSPGAPASPPAPLDLRPLKNADLDRYTAELAEWLGVVEKLRPGGIRIRSYPVSASALGQPVQQAFLNSLYLGDLKRVAGAFSSGDIGAALAAYLTSSQRLETAGRTDVRACPLAVRDGDAPAHIPHGRWVAGTDHALVLSQQFAVNQIMDCLANAPGLLAVNGPPGTGKTTMLRDVVAAVVVERAKSLARLTNPHDAFAHGKPYEWETENWKHRVVTPAAEVTGYEMLVASSNNGAVENITTEIPGPKGIAEQWAGVAESLDYFSATAKLVHGEDAWAMIAARLGKRANRSDFVNSFWWGRSPGGNRTARSAPNAGDRPDQGASAANNGMVYVLGRFKDVRVDWQAAVAEFRRALDKVTSLAGERQAVADALELLPVKKREYDQAGEAHSKAKEKHASLSDRQPDIARILEQTEARWQAESNQLGELQMQRPRLSVILSTRFRARSQWRARLADQRGRVTAAAEKRDEARREAQDLEVQTAAAWQGVLDTWAAHNRLVGEGKALERRISAARKRWADHVPPGFEGEEPDDQGLSERRELSAPWADREFTEARTRLFIAALHLHKSFIIAESKTIWKNLRALVDILDDKKRRPHAEAIRAAWQTFFLVVPVVSSTFASASSMLAGLGRESLGWLFIDEAGQAPPQQAAGVIWRAERVVIVGDPLQLEPVVTLPWAGQQALSKGFKVAAEWAPSRTSAQAVADRLAVFGTWLPSTTAEGSGQVWVGTPLRVHRRCDHPMFDICNEIAYNGLMVYGTGDRGIFHGFNEWCDVRSRDSRGHWIPAEGEALSLLLADLKEAGVDPGEIRVLSPFKQVVEGARKVYEQIFPASEVSARDRASWVGTIHTMQGKEADVIILVLGTNPHQVGARRWAAQKPNLLNVAVSRARRRFYVIGNYESWAGLTYFDALAREIPLRENPG
jgi:AAA domain